LDGVLSHGGKGESGLSTKLLSSEAF
ncbi:MAG: hypothetical protein PWQ67_363, partial [Clostridia bacterium]|nr:hypothetical protein [Clostridia bacterium]